MKVSKSRVAVSVAAGVIAAGLVVSPAGAGTTPAPSASSSPSKTSVSATTADAAPALVTKQLAGATLPPTVLWGKGKTTAGARWAALLATVGSTDTYVVDNTFGLGTTTGWHSHQGPSLIFVVTGTVTNYDSSDPSCAPKTYSQGAVFTDAGGTDVHMLRNEGAAPAETIAVQFIPQGQPRKTTEPEPANCHVS